MAKSLQTLHTFPPPPPKFRRVRLQTGYQPWRPSPASCAAVSVRHALHRITDDLYAITRPLQATPMVLSDKLAGPLPGRSSPAALGSPAGCIVPPVVAYYGRIRVSRNFRRLICIRTADLLPSVRPGLFREVPQFTLHVFLSVPSSIPRWIEKVHLTVSSLPTLAFARIAMSQHPKILHAIRFDVVAFTRLQSSLHVTAR